MIVYVGDNRKNEVTIKNAVLREDFTFAAAHSLMSLAGYIEGQQASMVFVEHPCSLIDAFEICKLAVKYNTVPVLIVRGMTKIDTQKALRCGVADIMVAPFSEDYVIERVNKLVLRLTSEGKPIRSQVSKVDHKAVKSITDKVHTICRNAKDILSLPPAVAKIVQLCNDESTSAYQVEQVAKADEAVAALILKRANSASYGSTKRIRSVQDAIVRLGLEETRSMALLLPVFDMMTGETERFGFNRSNCWFHSLAVGVIAFLLAQEEQNFLAEDAFLAGLLHDLGKVVLDDHLTDEYALVIRRAATKNCRVEVAEHSVLKMDHSQIGAVIGEVWNLPKDVIQAIRDHHKPISDFGRPTLTSYVSLGNCFAKCLGLGHSGDCFIDDLPDKYWETRFAKPFPIKNFIRMIYSELKHYAEMLDMDLDAFGVGYQSHRKDQEVMVCKGGAAFLLEAFFVKFGYTVRSIEATEIYKMDHNVWIAADDRAHKSSLVDILSMHPGPTFLLQDGDKPSSNRNLNIISPAQDFYRLDIVHRAVAANFDL